MNNSIQIINHIAISCHDFLFSNGNSEIKDKIIEFLNQNNFDIQIRKTGNEVLDSWIYGTNKLLNN